MTRARLGGSGLSAPTALFAAAAFLGLTACSSVGPEEGGVPRDVLSQKLSRVAAEVPSFGGVALVSAPLGEDRLVLYTLGEDPATSDAVRRIVGDAEPYDLQARPTRGQADPSLAGAVAAASTGRAHRIEHDPATGFVYVGVWTVLSARAEFYALRDAGVPLDDVVLLVEDRPNDR